MAAPTIGRRRRWAPPVWAKIDNSHPISSGIAACYLSNGSYYRDLVRNRMVTPTGIANRAPRITPWGLATASTCREASSHISSLGKNNGQTITVALVPNTLSPLTNIFGIEHDSGPSCFVRHDETTASSLQFVLGADVKITAAAGLVVGLPYVITCRAGVSTKDVWTNGARTTTAANAETGTTQIVTNLGNGIGINCATDFEADVRIADDAIPIAIWHNRPLLDGEIAQLAFDPFCFLRW